LPKDTQSMTRRENMEQKKNMYASPAISLSSPPSIWNILALSLGIIEQVVTSHILVVCGEKRSLSQCWGWVENIVVIYIYALTLQQTFSQILWECIGLMEEFLGCWMSKVEVSLVNVPWSWMWQLLSKLPSPPSCSRCSQI